MLNDPLANAMSKLMNSEHRGKGTCALSPISKTVENAMRIMHENNYIGEASREESSSGTTMNVNLLGNINRCGAIKPRFAVKMDTYERFEKRFLPAKDFGILIVSTSKGVMDHKQAKKKNLGGRLLAYCY